MVCFDVNSNVSTPLKHAKGERTEKVEKRDFRAVGDGILWLTPCKLACERSLETGLNIVASVGDGRSWWHHSFDHNRPSTRLIPILVLSPSCAHSLLRSFIRLHGVNHNQPFPTATSLHEIFTSFTIFIVFQCLQHLSTEPFFGAGKDAKRRDMPSACFDGVDSLLCRER